MHPRLFLGAALLCVSACATKDSAADSSKPAAATPAPATDTPATAPASDRVVSVDGIGKVKIGATAAELAAAIGETLPPPKVAEVSCRYMRPKLLVPGVGIMLVNDSVARIDVDSAGIATVEGAAVGDAESRVTELYRGRVTVSPHKYTGPTGHYLTVAPVGDSLRRIIFETDGQRVTKYRVGRKPAVEWVEGCS
jgi:hypothetical protein